MTKRGPAQQPRADRFAARTRPGSVPAHRSDLGPCLLWTGTQARKRGGYGTFYDDDARLKRAHRVAWEIAHNVTLTPDQHVLHKCDNTRCVNVEHLSLGDQAANMADMDSKGRRVHNTTRGTDQYLAVLSDAVVLEARQRFAAGEEVRDIVAGSPHAGALKEAIYGKSWKHVPMPSYASRERLIGQKATRCPSGHDFTADNTAYVTGKDGYRTRYCKECNRARARENARKRRAARS